LCFETLRQQLFFFRMAKENDHTQRRGEKNLSQRFCIPAGARRFLKGQGERERFKGRTVDDIMGPKCDIWHSDLDFSCNYRNVRRKQSNCDVTKTKSRSVRMVRRRRHKTTRVATWKRGDSLIHRSLRLSPGRVWTARRTAAVALEVE
jgi:hypothetical protein